MGLIIHIKQITIIMDHQNESISITCFFYYLIHVILVLMGLCFILLIDILNMMSEDQVIEMWNNDTIRYIWGRFFVGLIICLFIFLLLITVSILFSLFSSQIRRMKWKKHILIETIVLFSWHTIMTFYYFSNI